MTANKRQHRYPTARTASRRAVVEAGELTPSTAHTRLDMKDYILMNLGFALFLLIQVIFVRMMLPDMNGLYFLFGFLVVGFALVSAFDYLAGGITDSDLTEESALLA